MALNERYIDMAFFEPTEAHGSLQTVEYETMDYAAGQPATKTMTVYLPCGYDETQQYNVLFLLHTSGGNERTWLVSPHGYQFETTFEYVDVVNMIDRLIEQRYCDPMIVVSPSCYINEGAAFAHNSARDFEQFDQEFTQDILPYVAEHYATYAEGSDHDALVAARHHFGVLGASFGAYVNYISILATHMDLVANYTLVGGGAIDYGYCYERWSARGFLDYDIDCLYIVEGEYDDRYGPESSYRILLANAPDFFSDDNLHYSTIYGAGHEPRSWVNGLYNTMQVFFRDEPYPIPYVIQ
ncbi:MAG: hypothetical protein IJ594_04360, partial [Oscillospiraceae bacterium]|nr:hypothetical protein [Oscillospiraceae bacterium]